MKPSLHPKPCPHCGRPIKLYRRKLSPDKVACLIKLYCITRGDPLPKGINREAAIVSEGGVTWVYKDAFAPKNGSGDYAKMRFWGLIRPKEGAVGYWAITELGVAFVERRVSVPLFVDVFNNTKQDCSEELVQLYDLSAFDFKKRSTQ